MERINNPGFWVLMIFAVGCEAMMSLEEREKIYGKAAPVIPDHFAAREIRPGDPWRVYLKAYDPDGDMKYVAAIIHQAGIGIYPVSFTRIQSDNSKELSGYVYLNTMSGADYRSLVFYHLTLTVQIQDKAGHYSNPVVFPLAFQLRTTNQESAPPGIFEDKDLGPIMISLRPLATDHSAGR